MGIVTGGGLVSDVERSERPFEEEAAGKEEGGKA
jgi:hypothetical protein